MRNAVAVGTWSSFSLWFAASAASCDAAGLTALSTD